ncbi:hypothetical protein IWQ62_000342 [Dispira parvispora]|uniref:GATA-type domain-containing protein n=1 Tax=Dispira parvispora TaxID=1520584 RepID=A0A9W8AV03_9FUNG|nr:hypothetical protein IWQ62_000342 [Dispira parvispora]
MDSPELVRSPQLPAHRVRQPSVVSNPVGITTDTLASTQLEQTPVTQGKLAPRSLFAWDSENSPQGGKQSADTLSPTHVSATQWSPTGNTHFGLFALPPVLATEAGPLLTNPDETNHGYPPDLKNKGGESLTREHYRVDPGEHDIVIPETQLPESTIFHQESKIDLYCLSGIAPKLGDEHERAPTAVPTHAETLDQQRKSTSPTVIPETQYPIEEHSLAWDDVPETPLPAAALIQASRLATPVSSLKKSASISNYADHSSTPIRRLVHFSTHPSHMTPSDKPKLKPTSKPDFDQHLSHTIIPETQYAEMEGTLEFEKSQNSPCGGYSCDLYCTETQWAPRDELELPTLHSVVDGQPVVPNSECSSDEGVETNRRIGASEVGLLHSGINPPQSPKKGGGEQKESRAYADSMDLYHTVYDPTQIAPHEHGKVQSIPTLFSDPPSTPLNSTEFQPVPCSTYNPGSPCLASSPDLMSTCQDSTYALEVDCPESALLNSSIAEPHQGDRNVVQDEPDQRTVAGELPMVQGVNSEMSISVVKEEPVESSTIADESQETVMLSLPRELFNPLTSHQNNSSTVSVSSPIPASTPREKENTIHIMANRVNSAVKKLDNNPTEDTSIRRDDAQVSIAETVPITAVETLSKSLLAVTLNPDDLAHSESITPPPPTTSAMENPPALEPSPVQSSRPAQAIPVDSPATNASETLSECITRRSRVRRKVKLTTPAAYPDWEINHEFSPTRASRLSTMVAQTQARVNEVTMRPQTPATPKVRQCHHCGTRDSKQWRKGPQGLRSLCNPCGLWYAVHKQLPMLSPEGTPSLRPSKTMDGTTPTEDSHQRDPEDTDKHHNTMDDSACNMTHKSCAVSPIPSNNHTSDSLEVGPGSTIEHETDTAAISKKEKSPSLTSVCPHCKQCMDKAGRKARSKSKKKQAAKSTQLVPRSAIRSSLFSSILFIVTYPRGALSRELLGREQVESLVLGHGGQLIDSETEFVQLVRTMYPVRTELENGQGWTSKANTNPCHLPIDLAPKIMMISMAPRRTLKYLLALALGIPCVDARWLQASVDAGSLVELQDYLLPAGSSLFTQQELYPITYRTLASYAGAPNHTHSLIPMLPVFRNLRVYIDGSVTFRKNWARVIGEAGGAWVLTRRQMEAHKSRRVTQVLTGLEADELTWCDLVLCEKSPTRLLHRLASITRSRLQTAHRETSEVNDVACLPPEVMGLAVEGEWQQSNESILTDGMVSTKNGDSSSDVTSCSPPIVCSEWVVQCLIYQNLLHWDAHPTFTQWQK